ncbi:SDR family oxidoreductase [Celerinatantimonas yamalensis]|uniref:SDR family oxidoreductase n=1 Tax=Celerinatantimonas yamalensis TaxID=559956 RepID=A0ABW9GC52_9GAMM
MDLQISGKRALVMASSQGLGLGIARALAEEGAQVMLCGRDHKKLDVQAQLLAQQTRQRVLTAQVDLAQWDSVATLIEQVQTQWGGVDILVNNSGGPRPCTLAEAQQSDWHQAYQMMVVSLIELTKQLVPSMKAQRWGRILTVTSSGVEEPLPQISLSNTLRSALVGWNKTLANELADYGITCNILIPGRIHTQRVDMLDQAAAERLNITIEQVRERASAAIPVGRYGRVEEFAATAAFLVSHRASYITGSKIRCDGGAIRGI